MSKKLKVWIFTFEYAGVVKVGGLGEVPANQAKSLKDQLDITVFVPSHGTKERLKSNSSLTDMGLNFTGNFVPYEFDIHIPEATYAISLHQTQINGNNVILIAGNDEISKKTLEDPEVYSPTSLAAKYGLFTFALRHYTQYLIENDRDKLPDVVHIHDYHPFLPYIAMKQELLKHNLDVPSVITFHLLTWPRKNKRFLKACGIDDTPLPIWLSKKRQLMSIDEIFELARNNEHINPSLEKISAFIADIIISVSKSYLLSEVVPKLGNELIASKSEFVWDGCDWDYNEIMENIKNKFSIELKEFIGVSEYSNISRWDMRKFLLTHKIEKIPRDEPIITSEVVLNVVNSLNGKYPIMEERKVKSFKEDGPLILTSGRISQQKGFDIILESIPLVIEKIPEARFLMLIMPSEYSLDEITTYAEYMKKYPENLRILFGKTMSIYNLAHICADVYCCPSRWEPFGIIALEAMSSKIPVVATRVGGFQESIVDLSQDLENGTGILVEKENPIELANALISMLRASEICQMSIFNQNFNQKKIKSMAQDITLPTLKEKVLIENNFYVRIKNNCLKRVEQNFRWRIVSQKLIDVYKKAIKMVKF